MRILIYTPFFYPSMGGLEKVTDTLATALYDKGNHVAVFTPCALGESAELERDYKIIRDKSNVALFREVKNCDVFIHNSVSLRAVIPLLFYRKKWIVVHHMILANNTLKQKVISYLKKFVLKFAHNVAVSQFMADYYGNKSKVIPNPIDLSVAKIDSLNKDKDFVFMGRLIKDKGAHLALEALEKLDENKTLTIVGTGPEEGNLKSLCKKLKLCNRVVFTGRLNGEDLYNEIKRHKVLLAPSIWTEPFGVVVLEGYACGCKVVASDIGGLSDAVGGCGQLVKPNDIESLKNGMRVALKSNINRDRIADHLKAHSSNVIADKFIKLIELE
ncbi:glycosyltransferase family 4 protein [Aliiglaciecola aliphaticivorans]